MPPTTPSSDPLNVLTSLQASEQRYQLIFERAPAPMWVFDVESLALLAVNDAAVAQYGYTRDEFLGLTLRDLRPATELAAFWRAATAMRTGRDIRGVFRHRSRSGATFDVEITTQTLPFGDGRLRLAIASDVSERRRTETAASFLDRASALLLGAALDEAMLCRNLAALCVPEFGDWCAVLRAPDDARLELAGFAHVDPLAEHALVDALQERRPSPAHPAFAALRHRRSVLLSPGDHHAVVFETTAGTAATDWRLDVHTAIYVPILTRGSALGVLELVTTRESPRRPEMDVALAEELATRAGAALSNALLYQSARVAGGPPPQ
jgi:PAS domain S-box-containing protein